MNLCGININCLTKDDLRVKSDKPRILVTVNAEAIVRAQHDQRLKRIINENMASIDGQIPLWMIKSRHRGVHIEKVSGSDLIYSIPQYAEQDNLKVFLLGGQKDSNVESVTKLKSLYPRLQITGYSPDYYPYPFPKEVDAKICDLLKEFKPDILFVGFGMGKQEFWEDDHKELFNQLGIQLVIGCGGSFEFASGKIKRAPKIIQNAGLEGIWRLLKEFKWFRIKRLMLSSKIFYYYFKIPG